MHQQPMGPIIIAPIPFKQQLSQKAKQNPNFKIIKSIDQVELKCKRGVNSPRIHIVSLFHHMVEYHNHYVISPETLKELQQIFLSYPNLKIQQIRDADYFKLAYMKLHRILQGKGKKQIARGKKSINTDELEEVFADVQGKYQDTDKMIDFIVNRMNAKVLELIYRKYLMDIFFGPGSKKFEDRLTNMLFVAEYRSRLPNPLLCKHIECVRPNIKQKAYRKKDPSQKSQTQVKESQTGKKRTRTRKPNNSVSSSNITVRMRQKHSFGFEKTTEKIQMSRNQDDYFYEKSEYNQCDEKDIEGGFIDINEFDEQKNEKSINQRSQKKTKPIKKEKKMI